MEYLSFTKRERAGIISLVVLLILFAVAPKFVCQPRPVAVNISPRQLEQLTVKKEYKIFERRDSAKYSSYYPKQYPRKEYAAFKYNASPDHRQRPPVKIIDINIADTTALIALPGIGSKLASRIILFREKLGGFYSINQVREVYGLKDSVFQRIFPLLKCSAMVIRKLDINTAAREDLKQHPYIRWQAANILVEYRNQHGPFSSIKDLTKIDQFDSATLNRMMPYLTIN
jgi:competence protein ComEA